MGQFGVGNHKIYVTIATSDLCGWYRTKVCLWQERKLPVLGVGVAVFRAAYLKDECE